MIEQRKKIIDRFRKFLPVIIDVETGGFNYKTDALLEIAGIFVDYGNDGLLHMTEHFHEHVEPFNGANIEEEALKVNKIKVDSPFRLAIDETDAMNNCFDAIRERLKDSQCQRAILVGHNAAFDLNFINAVVARNKIKNNPLHAFTTLDTASLGALAYGETVLAKAVKAAGIPFNSEEAHSALYDATITADLFCRIVNKWDSQD